MQGTHNHQSSNSSARPVKLLDQMRQGLRTVQAVTIVGVIIGRLSESRSRSREDILAQSQHRLATEACDL